MFGLCECVSLETCFPRMQKAEINIFFVKLAGLGVLVKHMTFVKMKFTL